VSSNRTAIEFDCPWCGKLLNKQVYRGAETEIVCSECKQLIGIITDNDGKPIVIATKVHKSMQMSSVPSAQNSDTKLGKVEADIEKARKEAERRGLVVESKVYGAAIEIIDRLRDQLKQQNEMAKEIAGLKEQLIKQEKISNQLTELKEQLKQHKGTQRKRQKGTTAEITKLRKEVTMLKQRLAIYKLMK
jgi:TolA-binding protein